ncbi:hypothetical protein DVA67_033760 [Solirubrobacter sp. CPCC 204708]|uniref:Uncharacterized protein n=1 Tax=Solirubrobacter deserti TaxID=2282478 RepID=A0ABT4RUL3_9ACTN|nr:hypothetical protein [Solirubrobacter deserti]MBE2320973.1 hypothetical protein [Solirubrobacter deserti]MDA0142267.1 hypothetical protein [Solirubrobacter deserti]
MSQRDVEVVSQPAPAITPAPTAAPAPLASTTGPAGLAALGPQQRAAAVRGLSAGAGNAAVSRLLARNILTDFAEFKHDIDIDLDTATTEQKLAEIQRLHGKPGFGATVVWESMPDLAAVAKQNAPLFIASAKRDPTLFDNKAFDGVRKEFKAAVEGRVLNNLQSNRDYVTAQMEAVGVTAGTDPAAAETTADQDLAVRKAQLLAEKVALWQDGMAKAKQIKVGRNTKTRLGGYRRDFDSEVEVDATFDPEKPPSMKGAPVGREGEFKDYNEVKQHYDTLDHGVKKILAESPAVFAIVSGGEAGAAKDFAKQDTGKARAQLGTALTSMGSKIDEAVPLVGDDLDYRDFIPVHQQLMGAGPFAGELEKAIIQRDVEGHEMGKVLRSLALGALSAAAFLVAEFATAGMATFIAVAVGIGASVGNAALSIEDYLDKAKAHGARSGDTRNDIVTEEQVDSALFQAVMDSALAFIDAGVGIFSAASKALGPGAKLLEAAEAGAGKMATATLKEALGGGEHAAKVLAIEKSLAEAGIDATVKASGKSAEELATLVGKETESGKRLLAAAGLGKDAAAVEGLVTKLADFAKLEPAERATVMRAAIDQFGYAGALKRAGGWKTVTKTLGEGHPIAAELDAWRSGLVREMQAWMEAASKGESKAVQTGTSAATSDVDISTVGREAAQQADRALEFISRRAGVTRAELESVLDLDAAVNPARMHLQDVVKGLTPQARAAIEREAARFEEALTYSRRYHQAQKAGDEALMKSIEAEAGGALNKTWQPLGKDQIGALQKRMDEWSAALAKLEADGGSEAEKAALIQKIGRTQAEVLASSDTMYGTGGSIRTWVTERAAAAGVKSDLEKLAEAGVKIDPAAASIWPGQRFTAILGEGHFLDKAFAAIERGAEGTALVGAIKDFGKHGGRVVEILGRDVAVTGMNAAKMEQLADNLALWLKASKGPLADTVKDAAALGAIRAQLATQVGQLRTAMTNGVGALRAQAQLGTALGSAELAGIDAWVRAQAAAELRGQALLDNLLKMEQALSLPGKVANAAANTSESTAPEPNTSTPDGPVYSPPPSP